MFLLLVYFVKLSLSLAIVYLFYQLVLRKLTFYNSNRWYLAGYTFLSFLIPFINITPVLESNRFSQHEIVQLIPEMEKYTVGLGDNTVSPFLAALSNWGKWEWVTFVLLAGAAIFLLRFIIRCLSFFVMRRQALLVSDKGMKLYHINKNIIPFSFGNSVFINSDLHTEEELREIMNHEFVHVKQKHTIDIIWSEWLCIINWYNPFAWLLRSSIRQNLEFIADYKVLANGVDRKQYQYLLLKVIGNNHFSMAQKFNFSSLKKRITMMNKLRSAKLHLARFLFIVPLLAVILISFRQNKQDPEKVQVVQPVVTLTRDTVPDVTEPNDKGYIIDVIDDNGNCTLVIKDKNGKQVDRLLLTKWNENENYYEEKYGKIPPPPPPVPPLPPGSPLPPKLPANVKSMQYKYDEVEVWLKDGKKESYNLKVPAEKKAFEKKYGEIVPAPEAPVLPANPPAYPAPLKTGAPAAPAAPVAPVKSIGIMKTNGVDNLARLCDDFEITDKKAVMHLKTGETEEYDLTDINSRRKFEKKFGRIINLGPTGVAAPVAVVNHATGQTIIAPMDSGSPVAVVAPALAIGADGHLINGEVDLLVTITNKTTPQQLEELKRKMKEKGFELKIDNSDYKEGTLVNISGSIKLKDNQGNFSATDFNKVVISTVRDGERVYFRVEIIEKRAVI